MKHRTEGDKEKLPEATKQNQSQTKQTIETEDGGQVKRRIAWQIIQVQGPTVYATATVGFATFGATSTVCLTNNVCVALICSTATVVTTDTAVGATNTVGVTVTIGVATIGAAATVTTAATRTPGQLIVGRGDHTGRGLGCGREDRYTLSVAD